MFNHCSYNDKQSKDTVYFEINSFSHKKNSNRKGCCLYI